LKTRPFGSSICSAGSQATKGNGTRVQPVSEVGCALLRWVCVSEGRYRLYVWHHAKWRRALCASHVSLHGHYSRLQGALLRLGHTTILGS
jgi:hypothetical protein